VLCGVVGCVRNAGVRIGGLSENRNVGVGRPSVDCDVEIIDSV
jgi:hypothetical protein